MTIGNYLDYWSEYRARDYPCDMKVLYLKDWHCVKEFKSLCLYSVPKYFASDWLNEYYTAHPELKDDYMFVYMGPRGTWYGFIPHELSVTFVSSQTHHFSMNKQMFRTPFHADVFSSYSWSANIVGKKKWLLFPPGEEDTLRDSHGQLCFDFTNDQLLQNCTKYPHYNRKTIKYFEIIQNEGQVIFVPSGWHHQVWNLVKRIFVFLYT